MLRKPSPRVTSAASSVGETQRLDRLGSYKYPGAAIRSALGGRDRGGGVPLSSTPRQRTELHARFRHIHVLGMRLEARSAGS
jgi:hypothetical protein